MDIVDGTVKSRASARVLPLPANLKAAKACQAADRLARGAAYDASGYVVVDKGFVRLVIGAAEVGDLGVDTPEGISVGEVLQKGHRYPAEIIAHCVWLQHCFPLSFREVEELMVVRGVIVSDETIRQWCAKFGPEQACRLRRRQPRPADRWHLDAVFLTITGRGQYLWRAVDPDGNVLDILVQPGRDARAAKRFRPVCPESWWLIM